MTQSGQTSNPLSEIALAMAMAFFSVMVLALVSMGGIVTEKAQSAIPDSPHHKVIPLKAEGGSPEIKKIVKSALLIFHGNRFLNSSLEAVTPDTWQPEGEPVLALAPTATLSDINTAKSALPIPNITITTLDARWLKRLKEIKK